MKTKAGGFLKEVADALKRVASQSCFLSKASNCLFESLCLNYPYTYWPPTVKERGKDKKMSNVFLGLVQKLKSSLLPSIFYLNSHF